MWLGLPRLGGESATPNFHPFVLTYPSGKTLAFGLPILSRVKKEEQQYKKSGIHVLIVSPTRELAIQTHDTLMEAGSPIGIHSICLYGGVPKNEQKKALKGDKNLRIVVGTPGRLLDLVNDGAVDFSKCVALASVQW